MVDWIGQSAGGPDDVERGCDFGHPDSYRHLDVAEAGQWDAARALGLSRWRMMRLVILPQAIRRMVPPFVNQSITQLKNTSLVSVIAVPDLLYQGTIITETTYKPLEVYTVVAVISFILLFPSTILAQWYERKLAKGKK